MVVALPVKLARAGQLFCMGDLQKYEKLFVNSIDMILDSYDLHLTL